MCGDGGVSAVRSPAFATLLLAVCLCYLWDLSVYGATCRYARYRAIVRVSRACMHGGHVLPSRQSGMRAVDGQLFAEGGCSSVR